MEQAFVDGELEAQWREEGYVVQPLLDADAVERLKAAYQSLESGMELGYYTTLWSSDVSYRKVVAEHVRQAIEPELRRVLRDPKIGIAQFAVKRHDDAGAEAPLHQDWSFVDRRKDYEIAVWCPLVDVDDVNGYLEVVPGSHRLSHNLRPNYPLDLYLSPFKSVDPWLREGFTRAVPMKAGHCIFYDPSILHCSRGNLSSSDRVAVVAVAIPRKAQLLHYWRSSADAPVEIFEVEDDFYWRDARLGARPSPEIARLIDKVEDPIVPLTQEQVTASGLLPAP